MTAKEFLTTGEASKLLNISLSTVSRNFDKGVLTGQKNPITGERHISRESLATFMKQYNISTEPLTMGKKRVILGTSDEHFLSFIQKVFLGDQRLLIESMPFGGDVLVRCSKEQPDLLILDEELPDISCSEIIKSIRRMEEQKDLKILCGLRTENTTAFLQLGANEALVKENLDDALLAQKVYSLLDLPEEVPREGDLFEHQRRWPRISINLPAQIGVYNLKSPLHREQGKATLENISLGGAYLTQIRVDNAKIPAEPFRVLVDVDHPPLENWRAHCRVMRLQSNGFVTVGLQFVRLSKANRRKIEDLYVKEKQSARTKRIFPQEQASQP